MREMKVKDRKRKYHLIVNGSCQQTTTRCKKSPSQTEGEPTPFKITPRPHSHSSSPHHSHLTRLLFVLYISAILSSTTTRIGCLFDFDLRKCCDFNHASNVFGNEFKLEKSGLNDAYDFDFNTSITIDTIDLHNTTANTAPPLNFTATGVVSREVNILGYDFNAVLAPTVLTVTNENQIKMNMIDVHYKHKDSHNNYIIHLHQESIDMVFGFVNLMYLIYVR